jgi:thiamine-phosphate pyrophosphorylase|tara:strand:- start:155 stop:802 length:648 start_codon:yes stop_codon:yes gene_type:complete
LSANVHAWSHLYAIVDAGVAIRAGWAPRDLARAYLDGGARLLQLRATGVDRATLLDWCQEIVGLAAPVGARVIVNDFCDLVLMAGADGVHLGQNDLPVETARRLLGTEAIIGLSTHDDEQVEASARQPLSYVAIGPVYDTGTKDTGYAAVGLEAVRRTSVAAGTRPVVAIGGITVATAPDVIAAGAASIAVISDLLTGGDPARRVSEYLDALGGP